MNTLLKRLPRTIRSNQWLVYGSITLVMLACMLYASLNAMIVDIHESRSRFESESRIESATFLPQKPFADLSSFEHDNGLVIERRREVDASVNSSLTLRVFERTTRVDIPAITAGRDVQTDDEMLLGQTVATALKIPLGTKMTLLGHSFTVVGFAAVPDYMYPIRTTDDAGIILDPKAFGIAVITPAAMDTCAPKALATWHIRTVDGTTATARQALNETVGLTYWQDITTNLRYTLAIVKLEGAASVSTSMPLVILLLACLLLAAAQGRMVRMQRAQLGTLKAMGYSTWELVLQELALPALIALSGSVLGVLSSILTMRPMLNFMLSYFSVPLYVATVPWRVAIIGIVAPVFFTVPAVAVVAARLLGQAPVKLMQATALSTRPGLLERSLHLKRGSFQNRFAVRAAIRGLTRLTLLMLGAMLAGYLLLFGGAMRDSMSTLVRGAFQDTQYNYTYVLTAPRLENPWGGEALTSERFTTTDGRLTFQVVGLPATSTLFVPHDSKGQAIPIDRIIITRALAQKLNLKIGDSLTMQQAATGQEVTLPVDAVAEMYTTATVIMPQERLNSIVGAPLGSFNAVLSATSLQIPTQDVLTTLSMAQSRAAFNSAIMPLWVALGSVAVIAVFIALLALSIVTTLTVEEERFTISLLKVLGYRPEELNRMVLGSGIVAVATGFILGIPLLLASLGKLLSTTTSGISFSLPIRLSPLSILVCAVIMLATYLVSLRAARRKVLGVQMAVSLKAARE
ncbi:ABC transporter permease [Candidatus Cryosericum hinesii]|uniref:ABC transporter permease n=1 Tax=Candidatus Cryosericum hinesii TaxID=2290915 RepID=A0A398DGW8_9BACT|nr:ABC transporter permease [Candidatus Cryosericum hinesii]RIE08547.1 ABC transporter permease [Candidatus Cryosericum hinesii]RIE14332.1 ABC transporter permease [Candidatus Cryosericum hinesii]RIE14782.1 ABC transporter permease [Candidatus Cryosericum hinesii]